MKTHHGLHIEVWTQWCITNVNVFCYVSTSNERIKYFNYWAVFFRLSFVFSRKNRWQKKVNSQWMHNLHWTYITFIRHSSGRVISVHFRFTRKHCKTKYDVKLFKVNYKYSELLITNIWKLGAFFIDSCWLCKWFCCFDLWLYDLIRAGRFSYLWLLPWDRYSLS